MANATVSSKGQVVIPKELRKRLGIGPGSELEFSEEAGTLRVRVVRAVAPADLDAGYGLLKYEGPPVRLLDFDVAAAVAAEARKR